MRTIIIAAVAAIALSGCATNPGTGKRELTDEGRIILANSVSLAVAELVQPGDSEKIANIREIAVQLYDASSYSTVTDLQAAVEADIANRGWSAERRARAQNFINIAGASLRIYLGGNAIEKDAVVKVNDYLAMIVAALPPA